MIQIAEELYSTLQNMDSILSNSDGYRDYYPFVILCSPLALQARPFIPQKATKPKKGYKT